MLDIIGNLASVVGFFLTIWSIIQATKAKEAATLAKEAALGAREAVRLAGAAEEFQSLNKLAAEFLGHVESNQTAAAAVRARDLVVGIGTAKQRWTRFLSSDSASKLEEASAQVSVISQTLIARGAPSNEQEKRRLLKFSHDIVRIIAEEAGTITSTSELRINNE